MYFLRENAKEIKKVSMTLKTGEGCRHTQLGSHLGLDALHSLYNGKPWSGQMLIFWIDYKKQESRDEGI